MKPITLLLLLCFAAIPAIQAQTEFDIWNTATQSPIVASSFISDEEGWLADTATLWHTQDGGSTMDAIFSGMRFHKLDFTDGMNGFALSEDEAYKTSDGGFSWHSLNLESIGSSLYFFDSSTGFISGNNVIYKTTDNGVSRVTISIGSFWFEDYCFTSESAGIATALDRNGYKALWRTTDRGLSWTNVFEEINYYIHSVWFTNEATGWASGYYDLHGRTHEPLILQTTDGGITWKEIYRNNEVAGQGEELMDIRFKNEMEGFAISNLFSNIYTVDGGLTWTRTNDSNSKTFPSFGGIYSTLDGYSDMYLTGTDGYVVKWK